MGWVGITGQNGGWNDSRTAGFFLCGKRDDFSNFSMADCHKIWPRNVNPCPLEDVQKGFSNSFTLRVICAPKPQNWRGQTGTSLRPAYSPGDALQRDIVHSTCRPRVREFPSSGQIFVRRTVSELLGVTFPQFGHFCLFFPIQNAKKVTFCARPTAQGLHCRTLPVIPCSSGRPK